ncbi:MAG TPA: glycosyltransferase family 39 protein [Pyrinomonadaceae bacterium]
MTRSLVLAARLSLIIIGLTTLALTPIAISGDSRAVVFVPITLGLGLVVLGVAAFSRWQKAAFWFTVLMVGQAVTFQLINAGPQLRYQHYKPIGELFDYPINIYVGAVVLQFALVTFGMRDLLPQLVTWMRTNVRGWQMIILALCFFLPTTTVSQDHAVYVTEFIVAGSVQLLAFATLVLFAASVPKEFVDRTAAWSRKLMGERDGSDKPAYLFVAIAAVFVTLLAIVLNLFSYEQHPHVPDEVAYIVQAKFFAAGTFAMPAPAVPEAFDVFLMKVNGGLWYPVTPPGWPLLLSAGAFIGAPLIVNPILAGINVFLSYWLVKRLYSSAAALATTVLLVASPWFVFLAMSYMTHIASLTCLLVAAAGVVKARQTGKLKWGLLSGLAIGFMSMIRPLEAAATAGLIGLWIIGLGGKRLNLASIGAVAFGTLIVGSLGLAYNAKLTGDPLRFPLNAYADEVFGPHSNDYGFGPDRGMGWQLDPYPGHGPVDALVNTNLNVSALNTELLGWTIGSFLLIGAFVCFGKIRRSDYLMIAIIAAIYLLHFFYYFSGGPDFGARYWFLMILPLIVLTVRGIESLVEKMSEQDQTLRGRIFAGIGGLVVLTIILFIPWRAVDKYRDFRGMTPDVRKLNDEFGFGRSLVLVRGEKHPEYDSAFVYNSPDLSGDGPVFAWDRDPETRKKLLDTFSDRMVWIIDGPSITGSGYHVTAGPTTAAVLLGTQQN